MSDQNKLSMQDIHYVETYLPNTTSFANADLTAKNLNASIKQAEGSHQ